MKGKYERRRRKPLSKMRMKKRGIEAEEKESLFLARNLSQKYILKKNWVV